MNEFDFPEDNFKEEPKKSLPEAPLSIHIDTYFKGFHAGITIRSSENGSLPTSKIVNSIESLIQMGFKPSWNEETNNVHQIQQAPVLSQPMTPQPMQGNLGVCPKCGAPNKMSSKGNVFCSQKCWLRG